MMVKMKKTKSKRRSSAMRALRKELPQHDLPSLPEHEVYGGESSIQSVISSTSTSSSSSSSASSLSTLPSSRSRMKASTLFMTSMLVMSCMLLVLSRNEAFRAMSGQGNDYPNYTADRHNLLLRSSSRRLASSFRTSQGGALPPIHTMSSSSLSSRPYARHTLLYDDGTLFRPSTDKDSSLCDYFGSTRRLHTSITSVHLHLEACHDVAANEPIQREYLTAALLSRAANVPMAVTCGDSMTAHPIENGIRAVLQMGTGDDNARNNNGFVDEYQPSLATDGDWISAKSFCRQDEPSVAGLVKLLAMVS